MLIIYFLILQILRPENNKISIDKNLSTYIIIFFGVVIKK